MTDAEWAVVRDAMPVPSWLEGRGGQPEGYCHRRLVDAVRYLVAGGITWRAMPADFPAWDRVYTLFRRRRDKGLVAEFHDRLRDRVREAAGRDPEPTAGVIDAQSVKAAASVPAASRGFDGGTAVILSLLDGEGPDLGRCDVDSVLDAREARGYSGDGECLIRSVVRRVGQLGDDPTVTATERCRSWAAMSSISTRVPTNPVVLSSSAIARACARDRSCPSRRTRRTVTRLASGSISRSRTGPCSVKSAWRIASGVAPPLSSSHQATGQVWQVPSVPHHSLPQSMNWPASRISMPPQASHTVVIFTPWVITVLLVIGPARIVPYRLTFCDCISSPAPRLWKEVMSRLRITRLSARADRSGNWWPRPVGRKRVRVPACGQQLR
ncbi:transposase [Streptomyces sp. NPDC054865]